MLNKKMMVSLLAIGISVSVSANAASLTIVNNTAQDSTSIINNSPLCSSNIPNGTTKPHSTNVISETTIRFACMLDSTNCKADVYMTNNCSGPLVATVIFDVNQGIKSITAKTAIYKITGTGFNVSISN